MGQSLTSYHLRHNVLWEPITHFQVSDVLMISIGRMSSQVRKDFAYKLKTQGIYPWGFTKIVTFNKGLQKKCKDFNYEGVQSDKIIRFLAGEGLCVT